MPKNTNMAKRFAAETKNKKAFQAALDNKVGIIGRVEKALGNGGFQITTAEDGKTKTVQGLIRGVFKGGAKSEAFLVAGMYVILAKAEGRSPVHEILGVINKKKDLKALKDVGAVPASLIQESAADDLFDYAGLDEDAEMEGDDKKAYNRVAAKHAVARSGVKEALEALVPESPEKARRARASVPAPVAPGAPKKVPVPSDNIPSMLWGARDDETAPLQPVFLPANASNLEDDEIDISAI
jgi:hypothetical protein